MFDLGVRSLLSRMRGPMGKSFSSVFIFYESLISPVGDSSNYFKLAPLEKNIYTS